MVQLLQVQNSCINPKLFLIPYLLFLRVVQRLHAVSFTPGPLLSTTAAGLQGPGLKGPSDGSFGELN